VRTHPNKGWEISPEADIWDLFPTSGSLQEMLEQCPTHQVDND